MARTPIHLGEILGDELEEIGLRLKEGCRTQSSTRPEP